MNKNKIVSLFLSLVMIFSVVLIHDVSANVKDALEKQIEENNPTYIITLMYYNITFINNQCSD